MTEADRPGVAYKILTREQLDRLLADGSFSGAPVDLADGYIHMSTARQVRGTLDKHFAEQDDLHIAAVDLAALGDAVKWEASRGGALFPHLYAALPLSAVTDHAPVKRDETGKVNLPSH
ncbi:DUF952 domain-containing protein [Novosphingobium malaysiense]|uniref:DUF952 domain-containing protein n=1 Tax=Novosphingobium malaysiense TaxID=1348853 RepID=A0A0B1ZK90_9SPHN|nr:DUF952 domain-containing protein [Novosphingobium malaysiense]KHK91525.1 hypothetical protein LK12_11915 [Novosphingobium malaysiense]